MKTFVVDDEKPAREELTWLLEQIDGVEVAGQARDASEARQKLTSRDDVDLVFLDIDMPGVDGVRLAEILSAESREDAPMVAFVTAYDEYAVEAFDLDAIDYLLKPVRLERLQKTIDKVRSRLDSDTSGTQRRDESEERGDLARISVEDRGVYRVISLDEIIYFEADDGMVMAATADERYMTDFSLKFLEENLPDETFFRSHRSYIVRLDAIESIAPWGAGTYRLILSKDEDVTVPLARSRAPELKSRIPWSARVFDS